MSSSNSKLRRRAADKFREKVEFKFQFNATKVPNSGWEKLYVCLESTETGKATAKTAKSLVQAGTCRWPDAIIESTRMVHETRNNLYDAKLYKLVVAMSSTRVLGELTLNLADYVTSTTSAPASLALPLKNCSAGTVLHIKIQCLKSNLEESPRDGEQGKEAQDSQICQDDLDDSSTAVTPQTPSGGSSAKEKALARYNSDSSESSTPGSTPNGSVKSHDLSLPVTPANNSFNARLERGGRRASQESSAKSVLSPARSSKLVGTRLLEDKAPPNNNNAATEELRMEVSCLQANTQKLDQEVESLQAKIGEHIKQISEREQEITSLVKERHGLWDEVEQLRRASEFSEQRESGMTLQLQECGNVIKGLQELLEQERSTGAALELQLKKAGESNTQLAENVEKLESMLVTRKDELEDMVSANRKLETSLMEQEQVLAGLEKVLSDKLRSKEEVIKNLQIRCEKLEDEKAQVENKDAVDPIQMENMKGEIQELEADIKELTDENMELIFKLNMANKELLRYSGERDYVGMDGLEDKVRSFRKQQDANNERLVILEASNKQLQSVNSELQARVESSVEEIQSLKAELQASKSIHAMNMETLSAREQKLKARSDEIHEKYAMTFGLVSELETELEALKKENSQNKSRKEDLESELGSLEMFKADLVYRLANMESENATLRAQAQKYESQLVERSHELRSKAARISNLESRISALEESNTQAEGSLKEYQSRDDDKTTRIVELELQVSTMANRAEELLVCEQELESRLDALESERAELEKVLQREQAKAGHLKEKLDGVMGELEESKVLLQLEVSAREKVQKKAGELGSSRTELQRQSALLEQENWHLSERVAGLEAQLNYLTTEGEADRLRAAGLEKEKAELSEQVARLSSEREQLAEELKTEEMRWKNREDACSNLEADLIELRSKYQDGRRKLEQLENELAEAAEERTGLLERASRNQELLSRAQREKSEAVERLQGELQRIVDASSVQDKEQLASEAMAQVLQLRSERMELEESVNQVQAELESWRENALSAKKREDELLERLAKAEEDVDRLVQDNAELQSKEVETCQLKRESDICVDKLRGDKEELEATVQRLDELNARLQADKGIVEEKLSSLSRELEDKVHSLEAALCSKDAIETEQRIESMRLRKQNSDLRQKSLELKEEREELRLKIETMEAELKKRTDGAVRGVENGRTPNGNGVLARSVSKSNVVKVVTNGTTRDTSELRDRIKTLEAEVKLKSAQLESVKREASQKEMSMLKQIETLESSPAKDGSLVEHHQLKELRGQLSTLTLREQELLGKLKSHEMLQKETQRLQQVNLQLQDKICKLKEASKVGNSLERVVHLETELSEALESNNMYKEQLRCAFAAQHHVHAAALQNLSMSLKFAELEGEREELVMTIRSLKSNPAPGTTRRFLTF